MRRSCNFVTVGGRPVRSLPGGRSFSIGPFECDLGVLQANPLWSEPENAAGQLSAYECPIGSFQQALSSYSSSGWGIPFSSWFINPSLWRRRMEANRHQTRIRVSNALFRIKFKVIINVIHHRAGHTSEPATYSWHFHTNLNSFIARILFLLAVQDFI